MVTRLYGDPEDYMESRGTPEKIAEENHFVAKLREIFFDMDYRNITNVPAGCGLIRCAGNLVPFTNSFPRNTQLYRLMTTKPDEQLKG